MKLRWTMVAMACAVMVGCEREGGAQGGGEGTRESAQHGPLAEGRMNFLRPLTAPEYTYVTRGRITGLPGRGTLYVQVHHEEIPEFVGKSGEVTGMKEMVMDMPNAIPDVRLEELAVGDVVSMTFEVRYKTDPRMVITKIEKLPAETPLNLQQVVESR